MTDREDYSKDELEGALKRAFVDHRADFVIIDSRRQQFLIASAQLGKDNGWLFEEFVQYDEQSSALHYRLTDKGKEHFGLKDKKND